MTPSQFEAECAKIITEKTGDDAHRALDELVTGLLQELGYGAGMDLFIAEVRPAHK